jgi:hypothetical protein
MFHSAFKNAHARLRDLSTAVGEERAWIQGKAERLGQLANRLAQVETPAELLPAVDDMLALAKDWHDLVQKSFWPGKAGGVASGKADGV